MFDPVPDEYVAKLKTVGLETVEKKQKKEKPVKVKKEKTIKVKKEKAKKEI